MKIPDTLNLRSFGITGLLAVFCFASSFVSAAHDLYWTERVGDPEVTVIMGSDIDGENVTVVGEFPEMASFAVDVEITDDHVYWTGHNGRDLWRANRDGSGAEQLIDDHSGFTSLHFMAVDLDQETIYLTDHGNGVFSTDLEGGNITNLWSPAPTQYTGIAQRSANELLWITSDNSFLYLQPLPAGPQPDFRELSGGSDSYGLAYDPDTNTVYYTVYAGGSPGAGSLRAYNLDTDEDELLREGLTAPLGLKLSPSGTHLLIAERGKGVTVFQPDNYGYELLVESADAHFGVAVAADPADLEDGTPPPPPPEDGDVFLFADFQDDVPGEAPRTVADGGVWTGIVDGSFGPIEVVQDVDDEFGQGTDNHFVRFRDVRGGRLNYSFPADIEVATLSFDLIDRPLTDGTLEEGDPERGGFFFFRDNLRVHQYSMVNGSVRGQGANYPAPDELVRKDLVVNNSLEPVTYQNPVDGNEYTVAPESVDLWVNGLLLLSDYVYTRQDGSQGAIEELRIGSLFSTDTYSMDVDNITLTKGAHISEVEPELPPFRGFVDADFNGIPLGEITRDNADDFVHGNLEEISFHSRYDQDVDNDGSELPPILVAEDTEDRFGQGTGNQVLRTNQARGWRLVAGDNNFGEEVMTLRIDMADIEAVAGGRLTSRFYDLAGDVVSRIEFRATASGGGAFDPNPGGFGYGELVRFESVINNSSETITYTRPDGGEKSLISGGTDMWVNGMLVFSDSTEQRTATNAGPIMGYRLETFSTNRWDADIDRVQTLPGVQLEGIDAPEPRNSLQLAWELGPVDRDYLTDENRERGMTYNPATGNVLVAHRGEDALVVAAIDGATGDHAGTLSTDGIEGGIFPLNQVGAADDGAIYAANLTRDAGGTQDGPLKVYRWENEQADPVLVYEGDPSRGDPEEYEDRFGDTMAVRGSGFDTQILMAPRFGKNVTILTPDGSMDTFVDNLIVTDIPTSPSGWLTHGLAFGEGDTFFGTRQPQFGSATSQRGLVEVEFNLEEETGTVVRILEPSVFRNDVGPIGLDPDLGLLVGLDSYAHEEMDPRQPEVLLYDLLVLSEDDFNLPMDQASFGPGNLNGNGAGQVVFGGNGMVFVLDTNNGIAAYNVIEGVESLTFASWMDGLPEGDQPPEGERGPLDTPAGDGIANALKYALGIPPMTPGNALLPTPEVSNVDVDGVEADYLTLTFTRPDAVSDVTYEVGAGGDPGDLPDSAVLVEDMTVSHGDGTTTYTYRDVQPIDEAGSRFLRLSVELDQ